MKNPARTAVILAAGRGTRLGQAGRDIPKGFLQLGAKAIVEESILRLERAGVERIIIVTGHQQRLYEQLADSAGSRVRTVHNPVFATCGSLYSLACARADLDDDFLLLESDLIYEQRALSILQDGGSDAVLLSGPTGAGDEIWVETVNGRLAAMSKNRDDLSGEVAGEFVGISRVSHDFFGLLMEDALPRLQADPMLEYEVDGLTPAAALAPLPCTLVKDLLWAEIDDEQHLERARRNVYPAIVLRDGSNL
jgi:2-aminoethylphosphonate-pyruvate transaminase